MTELYAPWFRSDVENVGFSLFAMHQQALDDFIEELKQTRNPSNRRIQLNIAEKVGLDLDNLSYEDKLYISRHFN